MKSPYRIGDNAGCWKLIMKTSYDYLCQCECGEIRVLTLLELCDEPECCDCCEDPDDVPDDRSVINVWC